MLLNVHMTPIRQILVPVDFSEPSRAALDYAAELARPFEASIDLIHIWEAPTFVPQGGMVDSNAASFSLQELIKKNAEGALENFVAAAAKRGIVPRSSRAEPGSPALAIADHAKQGHYDLIVMGTHGRTGLSHVLIGSVAERVVRHAPCPVLSVRAKDAG